MEPISLASTFSAAISGVKTLRDMVTTPDAKSSLTQLYDLIIAGQQSALEETIKQRNLIDDVRDLKAQLAAQEGWLIERDRYAMAQPFQGAVTYALRKSASNGEPAHYICTHCYADGKKSVLNMARNVDTYITLDCRCKAKLATRNRGGIIFQYAEELHAQQPT
jgi:hypothetical protein